MATRVHTTGKDPEVDLLLGVSGDDAFELAAGAGVENLTLSAYDSTLGSKHHGDVKTPDHPPQ